MSILELDNKIPVKPPKVNKKIKPLIHNKGIVDLKFFEP